ncbi:uncharacterized protein B0I36DRAFT_366948 [Microdochium trichocladiopsis]|uniref:Uncharacterized protein n=1 Tax=Microdochium trichocladiopsis TaxID=1682393 RepID=A0A9P8XYE1_9PEZI|nr:uncharacterized protein B0I36DRAFT_366948 [Microdochium trichocladiopsis]KAH7025052.1 hypothetical protein B0I36DRAFT_366948 [Microdochium trichocladiopsis]
MKFFSILTFAAAVAATPMPGLELSVEQPKDLAVRQANLATVVQTTVQTVSQTINTSLDAITTAIYQAGGNITVQVQTIIEANLQAIADALGTGANAITAAIAAAGGNIGAIVTGYGLVQVGQLLNATNQLVALLTNLGVKLSVIVENLEGVPPAVLAALQAELQAINDAISPFVGPVGLVINAVRAVSLTGSLLLTGFNALVPGLLNIIFSLLGGI